MGVKPIFILGGPKVQGRECRKTLLVFAEIMPPSAHERSVEFTSHAAISPRLVRKTPALLSTRFRRLVSNSRVNLKDCNRHLSGQPQFFVPEMRFFESGVSFHKLDCR
jgi:hypothetical protein